MQNQILLSIIIPHFNSPELLLKLIHTIPVKDEIQIIIVDDNSTIDISKEREQIVKLTNVTWLRNDSGVKGAGAARNVGLKHATGKWLLFADADDYFSDNMYEKASAYFDSEYDMVYFFPMGIMLPSGEISHRTDRYSNLVKAFHDAPTPTNEAELKYSFCTPWSKLIRREVLVRNNIWFDQIKVSNDVMAITKCAYFSKKICADCDTIYYVTRQAKTLTSVTSETDFDTRVDALIRRYVFLRDHAPKKDFKAAHIDRIALSRLVDCLTNHLGMVKLFKVLGLYIKNRVAFFDLGLLNPTELIRSIMIQFSWSKEIKKTNDK